MREPTESEALASQNVPSDVVYGDEFNEAQWRRQCIALCEAAESRKGRGVSQSTIDAAQIQANIEAKYSAKIDGISEQIAALVEALKPVASKP